MSKLGKKRYFAAFGAAIVLFFCTSFIHIHRDQAFTCGHWDGKGNQTQQTEYRIEYGLPFAYIKRSASESECVIKGQDYSKAPEGVGYGAAEVFKQIYNKHEVSYFNLIVDLYIWLTIAYFVIKIASKQQRHT
jgi:hypothetical protein